MKQFCIKYKKAFIGAFFVSLLCFGYMLTHFTITIDEETWLLAEGDVNTWIYQGRLAIWLFNIFFTDCGRWVPFLWDFLAVVVWNIAGIIFAYGLFKERNINQLQMFFVCAYFSSLPFSVGEMLSFSCMNLQVSTGMAAIGLALIFSIKFWKEKTKKNFFIILLFLLYGISIYQAIICVYATAVTAFCLLELLKGRKEKLFCKLCMGAGLCFTASVVYWCINLIVWHIMRIDNYLVSNSYVGWKNENWIVAALKALANIGRISFAIPYHNWEIYGGSVIRCVSLLFMVWAVRWFFVEKGAKNKFWVFFYSAALYAAPFSLYVVLGTHMTHGRMLLGLSLAGAVQMYLIAQSVSGKAIEKAMMILFSVLLFFNAKYMNEIYYYSSMTYEKDCDIASLLMHDIQSKEIDYHNKPIVFVGMIGQDDLPVESMDAMGGSMFAWDDGSNSRMHDFLRCRGYAVMDPDKEMIDKAVLEAGAMKNWPYEDGICELNDMVVVRFSEPTDMWYIVNNASRIE